MMDRREMMKQCVGVGVAAAVAGNRPSLTFANDSSGRKFTLDLCPGRIGVRVDQRQAINFATRFGFESVEPFGSYLATLNSSQLSELRESMAAKGVVWGAAGLSVEFRRDDQTFRKSLDGLPRTAQALERAGVSRVGTWLRPGHDELTYLANFKRHVRRLRAVAKVLDDHGLRFGLEYVGPKTSWTSARFAFIHTMLETKELIAEIGADNVGLVLDSWHWYTAGEEVGDLTTLTNDGVVAVDLNDAPQGLARDEQIDNRRELPMATGVIDLRGFLNALATIGYDGPIRAEPFNRKLNAMENAMAVEATSIAMKKALSLVP